MGKTPTPTLNDEQQLFVLPTQGGGYSCLGYDVCERRATRLLSELVSLGLCNAPMPELRGTLARLAQYHSFVKLAAGHHARTGWRSKSELCPELIGLEGKRVEVTYTWNATSRFIVGKSTGWIPCHIALKTRRSSGGCAVLNDCIKAVKLV